MESSEEKQDIEILHAGVLKEQVKADWGSLLFRKGRVEVFPKSAEKSVSVSTTASFQSCLPHICPRHSNAQSKDEGIVGNIMIVIE